MTIEEYRRLAGERLSLREALEQKGAEADFEFDPPRVDIRIRPADLD
jgi:hypothetical protein